MKRIFVEYQDDPKVLIDHLDANADRVETDYHYIRELTEAEKDEIEARYITCSKQMNALEEEKKALMEQMKTRIDPVKKVMDEDIKILRSGRKSEKGTVYVIDDHDNRKSLVYSEQGILIEERPLRTKQKTIFSNQRESAEF